MILGAMGTRGRVTPGVMGITPGAMGITLGATGVTPTAVTIMPAVMGMTPGSMGVTPGSMGITPAVMGITPAAMGITWEMTPGATGQHGGQHQEQWGQRGGQCREHWGHGSGETGGATAQSLGNPPYSLSPVHGKRSQDPANAPPIDSPFQFQRKGGKKTRSLFGKGNGFHPESCQQVQTRGESRRRKRRDEKHPPALPDRRTDGGDRPITCSPDARGAASAAAARLAPERGDNPS